MIILAAVVYLVFWILGVFMMVVARRAKPSASEPLPPLSWYDREQVIRTLKAALAQGRLTEDEHDARAAQVSATRSHPELAALTTDLPADLTARLPKASYGLTGVCVVIAAASVAAAIVLWQPDNYPAFALALLAGATLILALAHNRGPDGRRTASEAVWRAATARANPQRWRVIVYARLILAPALPVPRPSNLPFN